MGTLRGLYQIHNLFAYVSLWTDVALWESRITSSILYIRKPNCRKVERACLSLNFRAWIRGQVGGAPGWAPAFIGPWNTQQTTAGARSRKTSAGALSPVPFPPPPPPAPAMPTATFQSLSGSHSPDRLLLWKVCPVCLPLPVDLWQERPHSHRSVGNKLQRHRLPVGEGPPPLIRNAEMSGIQASF